ncbi:MAG: hypothetical protein ACHQ01_01715 [Candidatus Limnocylindrales bacterium]
MTDWQQWQETDIPGLARTPVRPNLRARRLREVVASAYHEAGHAAAFESLGYGISSIWVTGEVARVGETAARCQAEAFDLLERPMDARGHALVTMAGPAAARRLGIPGRRPFDEVEGDTMEGILVASEAGLDVPAMLAEADAFVTDRWGRVEAIAVALLRSPNLALYPIRDSIIDTPKQAAERARATAWFAAHPRPQP